MAVMDLNISLAGFLVEDKPDIVNGVVQEWRQGHYFHFIF
jgi:hypothetical protein